MHTSSAWHGGDRAVMISDQKQEMQPIQLIPITHR